MEKNTWKKPGKDLEFETFRNCGNPVTE